MLAVKASALTWAGPSATINRWSPGAAGPSLLFCLQTRPPLHLALALELLDLLFGHDAAVDDTQGSAVGLVRLS